MGGLSLTQTSDPLRRHVPVMVELRMLAGFVHRTFHVLSGSNVCPDGGHWCGYGKGTPQSLLFSSTDLVTWKFKSIFWAGPYGHAQSGSLYTTDTFQLADGRQR